MPFPAARVIIRRLFVVHDLVTKLLRENVLIPHDFLPFFRFTHLTHIQHGDSYEIYMYPPKFLYRDKRRWVPIGIQS